MEVAVKETAAVLARSAHVPMTAVVSHAMNGAALGIAPGNAPTMPRATANFAAVPIRLFGSKKISRRNVGILTDRFDSGRLRAFRISRARRPPPGNPNSIDTYYNAVTCTFILEIQAFTAISTQIESKLKA